MDRVAFYGNIKTRDSKEISGLLREWVKSEKLDFKVGRVGVEIVHETEKLYLFCHEEGIATGEVPFYLLEGHMDGTLEMANARLQQLLKLCKDRNIPARLEYVQVNEDGDEVSKQFTVK